ncbi:MAG: STAS domain-containing protein [Planctomycetes bacterium]|nr:STAS domain-containing protein [Planctomycetota bacterium]
MSEPNVISIEQRDAILLAEVRCDRLDEESTLMMSTKVSEAAEKARDLPVVLDLSTVRFIPSLSLGALVKLLQEFKQRDQRFMLVGVQPPVRSALTVTRLDRLFEIYENVDEALAHLGERS